MSKKIYKLLLKMHHKSCVVKKLKLMVSYIRVWYISLVCCSLVYVYIRNPQHITYSRYEIVHCIRYTFRINYKKLRISETVYSPRIFVTFFYINRCFYGKKSVKGHLGGPFCTKIYILVEEF